MALVYNEDSGDEDYQEEDFVIMEDSPSDAQAQDDKTKQAPSVFVLDQDEEEEEEKIPDLRKNSSQSSGSKNGWNRPSDLNYRVRSSPGSRHQSSNSKVKSQEQILMSQASDGEEEDGYIVEIGSNQDLAFDINQEANRQFSGQ